MWSFALTRHSIPLDVTPSLDAFLKSARPGQRIPVWCELLFDADTAVAAYHKLHDGGFGFLLESVVGGEQWARYSFLGSRPNAVWLLQGSTVSLWNSGAGWRTYATEDPLADLEARLTSSRPCPDPELPRFWGGAVGYFGYDLVRRFEALGPGPEATEDLPTAMVLFTDVVVAVDNLHGRAKVITTVETGGLEDRGTLARLYERSVDRLRDTVKRLARGAEPDALGLLFGSDVADLEYESNFEHADFLRAVERIKEYIVAGDAYQVVLSQRLATPFGEDPFDLYRALRTLNPSPYLYHLELDGFSIVGSSPEVLVRLEDSVVTVRPIAGTRRRGGTPGEDRALAAELACDEKELAEHRMLVDLGRNDVGRVSEYGTVTVPELMEVERYSHVMHLCSQVEGQVAGDLSALDVLRACFPAGTVSGAPKVRAMEIIDELEPTARGLYAGAVGYVGWGAMQMDTAIAIRTMVVREGRAVVQAGAGIVADSDPSAEFDETLNKARALLRSAAMVRATTESGGAGDGRRGAECGQPGPGPRVSRSSRLGEVGDSGPR